MTSVIDKKLLAQLSGEDTEPKRDLSFDVVSAELKKRVFSRWTFIAVILISVTALAAWNVQISLQEGDLNGQVDDLAATTGATLPNPAELEQAIATAEQNLLVTQESSLLGVPDAQLSLMLIDVGYENGVNVFYTDIEPEKFQSIGEKTFPAKEILLSVEGKLPELNAFIESLEQGAIEGLEIQSTDLAWQPPDTYRAIITTSVYRQLTDQDREVPEDE